MPGSPKPQNEQTASDGASEADAAEPVKFQHDPEDGPSTEVEDAKAEPPDAAEVAGTKRKGGAEDEKPSVPEGTVSPEDLSTESDDGAG